MARTFYRDRFTWLAYLLLAFYGYFLNILGPITPFLKSELGLSYTISSLHFTAFAVGILLIGLGGHWVIQRTGRWRALWLGAGGMGLSALVLLMGNTPVVTIGACFLMGLVGSLILVLVPSTLADQHGELRAVALSEANVIASLVATIAPLMVGWFGWRLALGLVACTPIVFYLVMHQATVPATTTPEPNATRHTLSILFWIYWVALFLAVSVEFCMISWSADYLENAAGMLKSNAAQSVSLFFAGMILGRLAGSRLVQRFAAPVLVIASIVIAAIGFLLFWQTGMALSVLGGLFITGVGVASLYPLILSLAIGAANNNTVLASARTTLASGTAILTLPLVLGRLADSAGIQQAYGIVAFLLVSIFLIVLITSHLASHRFAVN